MAGACPGSWVHIKADHYRSTLYVGVTSHLSARVHQYREGRGSDFCARYRRREWTFALIKRGNPLWGDLFQTLA